MVLKKRENYRQALDGFDAEKIARYGRPKVKQLLQKGHQVIVLDNLSKPESSIKEGYEFRKVDLNDKLATEKAFAGADICIHLAAKIGGIGYFHKYPATILSENNKMYSSVFEAAVKNKLKRMVYVSSSMVFESASVFPTPEGEQLKSPPPLSTYGFHKLACEYFAKGAWEQYKLPYTIIRPFNCIGIGEKRALCDKEIMSGNVKLAMSHVVPDLAQKVLKGQDPLHILGDGNQIRHYTYGGDLARGWGRNDHT